MCIIYVGILILSFSTFDAFCVPCILLINFIWVLICSLLCATWTTVLSTWLLNFVISKEPRLGLANYFKLSISKVFISWSSFSRSPASHFTSNTVYLLELFLASSAFGLFVNKGGVKSAEKKISWIKITSFGILFDSRNYLNLYVDMMSLYKFVS